MTLRPDPARATCGRRALLVFPATPPRSARSSTPIRSGREGLHAAARAAGGRRRHAGEWEVRFIDENIRPATARGFRLGRRGVRHRHAHPAPSRSATSTAARTPPARSRCSAVLRFRPAPEYYPDFDYLHVGEMGDATDALFARWMELSRARRSRSSRRPRSDCRSTDFRCPAYDWLTSAQYLLGSIQFSSGCPYTASSATSPPLRPQPAPEDAAADHRRTRQSCARHGLRDRSTSSTTISSAIARRRKRTAAASRRVAEAQRLSGDRSPARRRSTSPSSRRSSR